MDFDQVAYILGFDCGEQGPEPFKGLKVAANLKVLAYHDVGRKRERMSNGRRADDSGMSRERGYPEEMDFAELCAFLSGVVDPIPD